jgi:site-specific DNA-cytosine methylase
MWALIHYAARCRPQFVVFESVQQAFKQGRPLMQALRQRLEEQTGTRYELFHVLHNAANVGGCAIRRRYFFVCAAMPFGLEPKLTTHVPTVMETIGDLTGLGNTIEPQPYRRPALSWWAKRKQAEDGAVCGHYTRTPPSAQRAYDLMNSIGWPPGEPISNVVRRYYQQHGRLPESWDDVKQEKLIASDFKMGFYQMHRWVADGPVRVVTGGAHLLVLHPTEPRLLTIREIARVQGFPDDWRIRELIRNDGFNKTAVVWGKGIPVECGQWIASWVRTALDGNPGTDTGKLTGDREHLIDYTAIDKAAMPLSLNGSRGG